MEFLGTGTLENLILQNPPTIFSELVPQYTCARLSVLSPRAAKHAKGLLHCRCCGFFKRLQRLGWRNFRSLCVCDYISDFLASSQRASISEREALRNSRPCRLIADSMCRKRRENFSLVRFKAVSGSISRNLAIFTATNRRSPTSSAIFCSSCLD